MDRKSECRGAVDDDKDARVRGRQEKIDRAVGWPGSPNAESDVRERPAMRSYTADSPVGQTDAPVQIDALVATDSGPLANTTALSMCIVGADAVREHCRSPEFAHSCAPTHNSG